MRIFRLYRDQDPTGVSGTGHVADGIEWDDGTVVVRWRGDHPTTVHHDEGVTSVQRIHGHGGATRVVWVGHDGRELPDAPEPVRHTARGFAVWAEIEDCYGRAVGVTESAAAEDRRVWVHAEDGAAHLDGDMAVTVRDALNAWLLWLGHAAAWRPASPARSDRAEALAGILRDLDRCEHGRHRIDSCIQCGGQSRGNPHMPPGAVVGYDRGGEPYTAPLGDRPDPLCSAGNPDAWRPRCDQCGGHGWVRIAGKVDGAPCGYLTVTECTACNPGGVRPYAGQPEPGGDLRNRSVAP